MEFTTKSGAKVLINIAPIKDGLNLKKAVQRVLVKQKIDIANIGIKNSNNFESINELLRLIMAIDSNDKIQDAIFICLNRCTYNSSRITEETFENINARADYYEIAIACLKENLLPFFQSLSSLFKELTEKKGEESSLK